eukprot:3372135-Heterocapsa_arctica.AAC.1
MCDLGHIKSRETGWAKGQGLQIGNLIRSFRQEDLARKGLRKAFLARGKPQEDWESWGEKYKDCCDWDSQKLIDMGE